MTDGGLLPCARELRRELDMFDAEGTARRMLPGRLAAWRASSGVDEEECRILFGVGLETLQRIECGEVQPSDELAERIGRIIIPGAEARPPRKPRALAREQGGAADPYGLSGARDAPESGPPLLTLPAGFVLALRDDGSRELHLHEHGELRRYTIAAARMMLADLSLALALNDLPRAPSLLKEAQP